MSKAPVIHWFRRDLRLTDNTALHAALATGRPVLPLFILDPAILGGPRQGQLPMAYFLNALASLRDQLREQGSDLVVREGQPLAVLQALIDETGADALFFNADYSPYAHRRDAQIQSELDIHVEVSDDLVLLPPGTVLKDDGDPYVVYSPFMRVWKEMPKPAIVEQVSGTYATVAEDWAGALPKRDLREGWPEPSAVAAQQRLQAFIQDGLLTYAETRNDLSPQPFADQATSVLSPYLRFGLLSPRQAYWAARGAYRSANAVERDSIEIWINELIWREFYVQILHHFPHVAEGNFRRDYDALAWRDASDDFAAWKTGHTGYPVIDAAMRQLWQTGWMPNRARMLVASFLTKHLLIDWRRGERHFLNLLIDGDPAANNGGWQWSAGTGTDAQPYFRIFNPVTQAQKYDPEGAYVRRWLPELRDVPDKHIHAPWQMSALPADYPAPMVDLSEGRDRALAAFKDAKARQD
jgi:deoxyribodipyrimidine photo-lyase